MSEKRSHIVRPDDHEWTEKFIPAATADRRGLYKKLSSHHGLSQLEARLTRIPPGESNTWFHTHSHCEEWFYVTAGCCHAHINGAWQEIQTGDSIATWPGEWHTFRNFGDIDCDILMVGVENPNDRATRKAEPNAPAEVGPQPDPEQPKG